jgi:putative nucleotidyltransferase with HDIG domain
MSEKKDMMPVPITDFINGMNAPVDLYVRLSDEKFVVVCKSGQKTDKQQLTKYQDRTIEFLWVDKEDYPRVVRNNLAIAGIIVNKHNISTVNKTDILTKAAASVFLQMEHMGIGFESYSYAKQIVEATVAIAEAHTDLNDLLLGLKDASEPLLKHSMAVSCVSVLIAHQLKWENRQTIEKVSLGALLHDIGKKALPPEILSKPRAKLSYDELQLYETHPYKGMQMLLSLGIVPDDIVAIVYEHHENSIGQGYPRKLRNVKIHPLAKVVALANEFCNLTIENPNCTSPKKPREALLTIEHTMGQPHNKEAFRALHFIVNREFAKTG